ncbi:hypothetical protein BRADI_4g40936v3 [Brachypodium distachyon]|uniref:Strictosidine synthase conserved region domain-containing protein n=1 Tax=Brachypodium distachyon TaxID=15368 RepID=A0A0Q3EWY5_BRADI|nr:hypothetical protein BRADI_4g40936v3 [Brachypodium distachyon]
MAGRGSTSTWLVLFVGLLAVFLAPSHTSAAEIKTSPTEHGFRLPLPNGVTGAESLAFDAQGKGPYAGVSDGRVLRWDGSATGWTTFAHHEDYRRIPLCTVPMAPSHETESICGRPLGLAFHQKSGDLYIADAYKGLLRVGSDGGEAEVLVTGVDGVPFRFVNGIDVDQATGDVYFTDSSLTYPRSHDRTYVVVAHTVSCQAHRYYLQGAKAGQYELMADLPGYPDNVRRDGKGGYWVALNQEKARPDMASMGPVKHLVGVRLDENGVQVEVLTAAKGVTLSEVSERNGRLWLGSVELDYIGLV